MKQALMENKMNKEELIDLVIRICNVQGTEEEIGNWLQLLEKETGCPEISDYNLE